jgi:endonuclease YncB( thermonuclease family)
MKNLLFFTLLILFSISIVYETTLTAFAEFKIPNWIKNNAGWWADGSISNDEFLRGVQYLINQKIIVVDATTKVKTELSQTVPSWVKNTAGWWSEEKISDTEFVTGLKWLTENGIIIVKTEPVKVETELAQPEPVKVEPKPEPVKVEPVETEQEKIEPYIVCLGKADCIRGKVTKINDGDTIKVNEISVRFALTSTPEIGKTGGIEARDYIEEICPVGSDVVADEDDGQTEGSYGRTVAKIYCNGFILNESILEKGLGKISTNFCSKSEFASEPWARKFGC